MKFHIKKKILSQLKDLRYANLQRKTHVRLKKSLFLERILWKFVEMGVISTYHEDGEDRSFFRVFLKYDTFRGKGLLSEMEIGLGENYRWSDLAKKASSTESWKKSSKKRGFVRRVSKTTLNGMVFTVSQEGGTLLTGDECVKKGIGGLYLCTIYF